MSKLILYGAIARALHYQAYRRQMQRKADLQSLGTLSRWFADVYEWWHA
jgi:hypothetical protein